MTIVHRSPSRFATLGRLTVGGLPVVAGSGLSACTAEADPADVSATVDVSSTSDGCVVAPTEVAAGVIRFDVSNDGDQETEFYVYADDGESIKGEVEDIGPGLSRDMILTLDAGTYVTACKPGMTGDGIQGDLIVTG